MRDVYAELERLSARYTKQHGLFVEFYKASTADQSQPNPTEGNFTKWCAE